MSTSLLFWVVFIMVRISQNPSTAGWEVIHKKCIQIYKQFNTYSSSKRACELQKSSLFSIKNQDEFNFITNLQRNANMWIGLRRNSSSRKWYWSDGREFVNLQWWRNGDPHYKNFAIFRDGTLRGGDAATTSWHICEKKANYLWSLIDTSQGISSLCGVEIMANCDGLPCGNVCYSHPDCDQFAKMANVCVNIKNVSVTDNCIVNLRSNLELYRLDTFC